jgi:hypothetical protein
LLNAEELLEEFTKCLENYGEKLEEAEDPFFHN